jgi:hypothetical protein
MMRRLISALVTVLGCVGCAGGGGSEPGGSAGGSAGNNPGAGGSQTTAGSGGSQTTGGAGTGGTLSTAGSGGTVTSGGQGGSAQGGQGGTLAAGADGGAHVATWVPPYRVPEAKQQLAADFGGLGMADGLSFLALQFWLANGASTTLDVNVSEEDISWFRDWAHQHGVKILLCIHNNTGDWNWPQAVSSFRDNRDAFVSHVLSEVAARDFDGVDVDFEGIVDATADEAEAYRLMIEALSSGLHPQGKVLTVDSFHGMWNAPNWNWWPNLLPLVDGITSMGYEQSGLDVDYPTLVEHAAAAPEKLMIGVPGYQGTWLGHSVTEHLDWIVQQGQVGTAIWDASLSAAEWQQRSVWEQLGAIKAR